MKERKFKHIRPYPETDARGREINSIDRRLAECPPQGRIIELRQRRRSLVHQILSEWVMK